MKSNHTSIRIQDLEIKVGKTYKGKILSIMPYGVFVRIGKSFEGILDLENLNEIEKSEIVEGNFIQVELQGIIFKTGKLQLSPR